MSQLVERGPAHVGRKKSRAASQLTTPLPRHRRNQVTPWRSLQGAERHARSATPAADAEYRDCSCGGAAREAQSQACKITPLASGAHGCLTPRSSGAPTAGHAGHQALGLRPILRLLPSASCRRRPLSSNVRPHSQCFAAHYPSLCFSLPSPESASQRGLVRPERTAVFLRHHPTAVKKRIWVASCSCFREQAPLTPSTRAVSRSGYHSRTSTSWPC
jgi:hypothetical protein